MEPLSQEFIESCRRENGRIIRGDSMTRIETFVDAAFAFSFTMLVISIDEIPRSPGELFELSRDIPAFVFSALTIAAIWLSHSNWSRVFGLQDRVTVNLSLALVMLVLIFVYPIKLISQATVLYLSLSVFGIDFLDTGLFDYPGWAFNEVADLFVYVALFLVALAGILIGFSQNALRYKDSLHLNEVEKAYCYRMTITWFLVILTALASLLAANIYEGERIARAGYIYFTLYLTIPMANRGYARLVQNRQKSRI